MDLAAAVCNVAERELLLAVRQLSALRFLARTLLPPRCYLHFTVLSGIFLNRMSVLGLV